MTQFYTPDASLYTAEKLGTLLAKREEKEARLNPQEDRFLPEELNPFQDLIDLGQSATLRDHGLAADFAKNASNYALGTEFDSGEESGLSDVGTSDSLAGMRAGVRKQYEDDVQQVYTDVASGNLWDAAGSAFNVAGRAAADSAGSIVGAAEGAALTGGLSILNTGRRLYNAVDGISDKYAKTKKALEIAGKVGKYGSQASVNTAAQTQRLVHQYQKEHNGALPSNNELLFMGGGTVLTEGLDIAILKNLVIPGKHTKELKNSISKAKDFVSKLRPDRGSITAIAKEIAAGSAKILKVAGAEGVQEYIQTWHEILATKLDTATGRSLWDDVQATLGKKENQDEALTAGFVGTGAGGATKASITVPASGVKVAGHTAAGAVKTAYKTAVGTAKYVGNRSSRGKLSEQEKVDLNREYKAQSEVVKQKAARLKGQEKAVAKASKVEDLLADEAIAPLVKDIQASQGFSDEDMQNPEIFKQVKKGLGIFYSEKQKKTKEVLDDSNLSYFKRRSGSVSKKPAPTPKVEDVSSTTEYVSKKLTEAFTSKDDKGVEKVDTKGHTEALKKATAAIEELESPLALQTIERAIVDGETVSPRVLRQAKNLSTYDLERVAAVVQHTNPNAAKALLKVAKKKESAISRFTPSKSKIIDDKNIPKELVATAHSGVILDSNIHGMSVSLSSAMHKKLKGAAAVNAVLKTVEAYEKTEAFKKQIKGTVHPNTLAKWKKRLTRMAELEARKPKQEEKVEPKKQEKATKPKEKVTEPTKEKAEPVETKQDKEPKVEQKDAPKSTAKPLPAKAEQFIAAAELGVQEGQIETVLKDIPKFAEKLKKLGYTTKESVESLLKQYPALSKNEEVLNVLKLHLYDDNVPEPEVTLKEITDEKVAKAAYTKLFPGCKP